MRRSVIISGGGSRAAWAQGLLASPTIQRRFKDAEVYAGVSAGSILSLLCARYVDEPGGLQHVSDIDFGMLPHWGGMGGILVTAMVRPYVFSHREVCDMLYRQLGLEDGGDAQLNRELTVGICDIQNNHYMEKTFPRGAFIRENKIVDYVAASSSIYGLFEGWKHAGKLYQDGGYAHNIPVEALRNADKKSLIISLIPLDVTLPGSYGGEGFWKFIMAANITFYHVMYSDLGRDELEIKEKTENVIIYDTPYGELWGSIHRERFDFVLTYQMRLIHDLKRDGELAAQQRYGDVVPMAKSPPPRHIWPWVCIAILGVIFLVWWLT